ncbi:Tfp pilus assembly protein FimT-like protein [Caballeronia turbans]|jgi:type IV fimbrial biogenesis protein FimT|uniref:GspH/FimT family pseudopilin n=1 Tax=Caballeronia sp. INML1 TaxID=2921760 RepID=UPI00074CC48D|nr:GspH/FimT family pseudopilin [Caballeronia sp. INML1]SAL39494.1 Tfp pilus assembly protein FimT-like protein [Caballeronia turbans]
MISASNQGFTLVELCVVLAVMAILATFAAPSFVAWQVRDQVDARARSLFSAISLARAESIKRGARVTLCRIDPSRHCLAAGRSCDAGVTDWSCGWGVFVDRDGVSTLLRMQPAMTSVAIAGTSTELSFTPPSGQVIGGFRSFELGPRGADAAANPASRRCVRLAAGGRARITQGGCGASA